MGVSILKANKNGQTQLVLCSTANVGIDLISSQYSLYQYQYFYPIRAAYVRESSVS